MTKVRKMVTYCLVGSLVFTSGRAVAQAAEVPVAGIDLVLDDFYQNNKNADEEISDYISSLYKGISFAQVTNYVNIRSKADENSEVVGKLYDNCAATILDSKGGWYKVKSGSVTGYIKSDYLVIGPAAEKLSETLGEKIATVTTTTLKVRESASTDSTVLTLVPIDSDLKVLKVLDGWIKVSVDSNTTGYVSADYVKVSKEYVVAVSIAQEKAKLAAEEAEKAEKEQSSRNSGSSSGSSNNSGSSSGSSNNSGSSNTHSSSNSSSSNSSSLRNRIVDYALRFEGNPYVWGGTSLTNGADCSGFTQAVLGDYGIYIPRTSQEQAYSGRRVSIDNLRPGDLVFYSKYGSINHVAMYIGNGQVISASSPSTGIRITSLYYRNPVRAVNYID